jgi:hypothetical protein
VRPVLLTMAAATVGLAFCARVLIPAALAHGGWDGLGARLHPADPAYLANAPTVLFAGLLLAGLAGLRLYVAPRPRTTVMALGLALLAAVPFVTMGLVVQRATIGLGIAGLGFLLAVAFCVRPYRAAPLWAAAVLVLALLLPGAQAVIDALAAKNAAVGLNMRWQEARAVYDALGDRAGAVLAGQGWGATVISPAVGGYPVNYTHNFITTCWLKTGLCGVGLALAYVIGIARLLWPLLWARPVLAVALGAPLAIDLTLYASFKSLDFGLILLLAAVWGSRAVSLHKRPVYSMS